MVNEWQVILSKPMVASTQNVLINVGIITNHCMRCMISHPPSLLAIEAFCPNSMAAYECPSAISFILYVDFTPVDFFYKPFNVKLINPRCAYVSGNAVDRG